MAGKQMVYTGSGLEVVLPDSGEVRELGKGDVVDFAQFGGEGFFAGRADFKPHTTKTRKGKSDG